VVAVLLAVSACAGGVTASPEGDVPMRLLAAPAGNMFNIAWLPDGRIYFGRAVEGGGDAETWRIPGSGGTAVRLRLPDQPGCRRTEYMRVEPLPDGQLGLTRYCSKDFPLATDTGAVDPRSVRFRPLAPLGDLNPSAVTWRKGLRRGFLSWTTGSCAGIAPLTRQGPQRLPDPATLDGKTWRLDEDVFAPGDADCTDRGRADLPVLSPDERHLYFLASPESVGVSGSFAREETPWRLYRWTLTDGRPDGQPSEMTGDLGKPLGLGISPDGRSLAFAGQRHGRYGLWLLDASTGAVRRLARGKFMDAAYSPDGRHLAAIFQQDGDHCYLHVLDLPDVH
jgi:hypothetical protein